jgi:hypothetical protein
VFRSEIGDEDEEEVGIDVVDAVESSSFPA